MSELTGDPVWTADPEGSGDLVAEFHGFSLVVTPRSGKCTATVLYTDRPEGDDVLEHNLGEFDHPAHAMRAAINQVLAWRADEAQA